MFLFLLFFLSFVLSTYTDPDVLAVCKRSLLTKMKMINNFLLIHTNSIWQLFQ